MPRARHLRSVSDRAPSSSAARHVARDVAPSSTFRARITDVQPGNSLIVEPTAGGPVVDATLALLTGYVPTEGDVVACQADEDGVIAVAVIQAARTPSLHVTDGSFARTVDGRAIELCDAQGALLLRYEAGALRLAPLRGDLELAAPAGRVRVAAGVDIDLAAGRDVAISGTRSVETRVGAADRELGPRVRLEGQTATVAAAEVGVRARRARLTAGVVETIARELVTSASTLRTTATAIETAAERLAVRAKSIVQEADELYETRTGRLRTIVAGLLSMRSKSTSLKSEDDTAIDGRRVLLG